MPIPLISASYANSRSATTPAATAFAKRIPAPPMRTTFSHEMTAPIARRISLSAPIAVRIASMTAMAQPAPGISFAMTFVMMISPMITGSMGTTASHVSLTIFSRVKPPLMSRSMIAFGTPMISSIFDWNHCFTADTTSRKRWFFAPSTAEFFAPLSQPPGSDRKSTAMSMKSPSALRSLEA